MVGGQTKHEKEPVKLYHWAGHHFSKHISKRFHMLGLYSTAWSAKGGYKFIWQKHMS